MARVQHDQGHAVERFHATSGRVTGWMALGLAALVTLAGLAYLDEGFPHWVIGAAVLGGVLSWAAMLRPALWVAGDHLVMRNLADTVHIRLAAVEEMAVRQVLAVRADDRRWVSTVVGRSWRKTARTRGRDASSIEATAQEGMPYADYVENRLHELVDDARRAAGVRPGSQEQLALADAVRRERDWLPLSLIGAAVLVLLLTLLL